MANAQRGTSSEVLPPPFDIGVEVVLSVAQAAELSGMSVDTIRRLLHLHSGGLPGAARDGTTANAAWLIPGSALFFAGLCTPEVLTTFQASTQMGEL